MLEKKNNKNKFETKSVGTQVIFIAFSTLPAHLF